MDESRRNFLKIAGAGAVGAAVGMPLLKAAVTSEQVAPWPGGVTARRWALAVDIRRCSAPEVQRACAEVCHAAHNVPHVADARHQVKWIWSTEFERAFPDQKIPLVRDELRKNSVLVLCNHCERPPCVRVCPTGATFKRKDGIVMMDMHRCIGCRYCIAACPYGARSFNWEDPAAYLPGERNDYPHRTKGVVEKCTLCVERLARGLEPACVEVANRLAGPGAMYFGDITDATSPLVRALRERPSIRRKPVLGTEPHVFYLL